MDRNLIAAGVLMLSMSVASGQTAPDPGREEGRKSPPELFAQATRMFPEPLAKQVQQRIMQDLQNAVAANPAPAGAQQSFATFYLADELYAKLRVGTFENAPRLIWNGYDAKTGTPMFLFEKGSFGYVTPAGRRIVPNTMDTDGGSIPQILHSIGSFTAWGYGPAYIIHDWLFVAHKCGGTDDSSVTFEESALHLAEAIKTLMEKGFVNYDKSVQVFPKKEDTLYLIYQVVRSDYALSLWQDTQSVKCRRSP